MSSKGGLDNISQPTYSSYKATPSITEYEVGYLCICYQQNMYLLSTNNIGYLHLRENSLQLITLQHQATAWLRQKTSTSFHKRNMLSTVFLQLFGYIPLRYVTVSRRH